MPTEPIVCEMCWVQPAIGKSGAVPICDECIVEFGVNPQDVRRTDGLSSEWVSPVVIAQKDARVADLERQVAATTGGFLPQPIGSEVKMSRPSLHLFEKWGLTPAVIGCVAAHTPDGHVEVDFGDGERITFEPIDLDTFRS